MNKRFIYALAALSCLLLAVGVAGAFSGEGGESPGGEDSLQKIEEAVGPGNSNAIDMQSTNPQAADELPHTDLNRDEALTLLRSVFSSELQAPAGTFDELDVEKFLSPTVAVVAPETQPSTSDTSEEESGGGSSPEGGEEGPALVESTLPLRTEDTASKEAAVDLNIEHAEGELQPANPLVEVGIPTDLGEGLSLPEQEVTIKLAGAAEERSPSTVDHSTAFFPNVAQDSDLSVALTPTGLETLTQLRSADSPRTETFHLTLPDGATLKETDDGGAEVIRAGKPLISVPRPSAIDAEGNEVPVSLDVSGNSIALHIAPTDSTAYPALVDPLFETYDWPKYYEGMYPSPSAEQAPPGWYAGNTTPSTY
ncbi:MAG TPA: hypothetical protein VII45_04810, partial [Solirubrobacterales bacterium]